MQKEVKALQKIVDELLGLMSTSVSGEASFDKKSDSFIVNIKAGEETGLFIGKKGETLSSIQAVLGLMLKQGVGDWKRVIVNVGDYREKEEDYLKELAESAKARAKETGEDQPLYNLKPWQRRVVHIYLSEDKDIITESVGEGEERYLIVKTKK